MKTLDEKSIEYSVRLSNQSGNYTKGEIETAYVTGAAQNMELIFGEEGAFGQALTVLQHGFNIACKEWRGKCFITKQIDSDIASDIVPKMQSLPDAAKKKNQQVRRWFDLLSGSMFSCLSGLGIRVHGYKLCA